MLKKKSPHSVAPHLRAVSKEHKHFIGQGLVEAIASARTFCEGCQDTGMKSKVVYKVCCSGYLCYCCGQPYPEMEQTGEYCGCGIGQDLKAADDSRFLFVVEMAQQELEGGF